MATFTDANDSSLDIPNEFYCPVSYQLMEDPVTDLDGYTCDKKVYVKWIQDNGTTIFTRRPITVDDLVPNRALKDAIDQIRDKIEAHQMTRVVTAFDDINSAIIGKEDFSGNKEFDPIINKIINNTNGLDITIKVPSDTNLRRALPVHLVLVVDVSYSMRETAVAKDEKGNEAEYGLCILDIVKHACQMIRECLKPEDYLSIVSFADIAKVVIPPTKVDSSGTVKLQEAIKSLECEGRTNMWDACVKSLDLCLQNHTEGVNQKIMLLTDGQPNPEPTRGFEAELKRYAENNNGYPAAIDTFGFGYSLDSQVLSLISSKTGGNYCFIPDPGMVGDLFSNAMANVLSIYTTESTISITTGSSLRSSSLEVFGARDSQAMAIGNSYEFKTGPLLCGQSRTFTIPLDESELNQLTDKDIEVCLSFNNRLIESTTTTDTTAGDNDDTLKLQVMRIEMLSMLTQVFDLMERVKDDDALNLVNQFIDKYESLAITASTGSELLKDIRGEIMSAIKTKENYLRWGKHYIPSLLNAHKFEYTNNFKDPGIQAYGGDLFKKLRDSADEAFNKLPPPEPSERYSNYDGYGGGRSAPGSRRVRGTDRGVADGAASGMFSMASYNVRGGVCFHASSIVYLADGTRKLVRDITKGDIVLTSTGSDSVECIVRTQFIEGSTLICELDNGLLVTPNHPVYSTATGNWFHPSSLVKSELRKCNYTYSFLLSNRTSDLIVNGWTCGTLGHGIENDEVLSHFYFGTEAVVDDLKKCSGWDNGCVTIVPEQIIRQADTNWIIGISSEVPVVPDNNFDIYLNLESKPNLVLVN